MANYAWLLSENIGGLKGGKNLAFSDTSGWERSVVDCGCSVDRPHKSWMGEEGILCLHM